MRVSLSFILFLVAIYFINLVSEYSKAIKPAKPEQCHGNVHPTHGSLLNHNNAMEMCIPPMEAC
jgi:hypothetical protein